MKILSPQGDRINAGSRCRLPTQYMAGDVATIQKVRAEYDDLAVVCYINSTAELKKYSRCCVTSSNGEDCKSTSTEEHIFLSRIVIGTPHCRAGAGKHFIYNSFVRLHERMEEDEILEQKAVSEAEVLAHPECKSGVLKHVDC